jgi:hypothetical protein
MAALSFVFSLLQAFTAGLEVASEMIGVFHIVAGGASFLHGVARHQWGHTARGQEESA